MLTLRGEEVYRKIAMSRKRTRDHRATEVMGHEIFVLPYGFPLGVPSPKRDNEEETTKWTKYAKLILPHVGLVLMCIIYTIGGALVFYLIEKPHEVELRNTRAEKIYESRQEILEHLWHLKSKVSEAEWRAVAAEKARNFTYQLFDEFDERYISESNIQGIGNETEFKWTFPSAVFFAATTITTIGYGDLVPVTMIGKILCVAFGLLGVPLMLVTIADVGKFISDFIVFLYIKYYMLKKELTRRARGERNVDKKSKKEMHDDLVQLSLEGSDDVQIPVTLILLIVVSYTALGGVLLRTWETEWTFLDSFYFSFITMTTVGFGDLVPKNQSHYALSLVYIVLGLAITTMCVDLAGSQYIKKIHYFGRKIRSAKEALRSMGELMHYAAFLRKKYGLTDEELNNIPLMPDAHEWQEFLFHCAAFTPEDIGKFRFIDQWTDSLRESLGKGSTQLGSIAGKEDLASVVINNNQ